MKHTLSPRQSEIMWRICQGMLAKEIAGDLAIKLSTVKAHLKAAKRRLNARTLAHASVVFIARQPVDRNNVDSTLKA